MSALPLKADMRGAARDVRFGPKADIAASFDHLIGAGEQRRWHSETERFGSLQVDDEIILGRRLHREIARFLALEDAINIGGRARVLVTKIRPIRYQSSSDNIGSLLVRCRQFISGSQRNYQITMDC
jgi:dihydrofolate reductase